MNKQLAKKSEHVPLLADIQHLINQARQKVASVVDGELTMLYWKVGYRINVEVLKDERAEYGQSVIEDLACSLTIEYGRSFEEKNLRRMIQFAELFPDEKIVAALRRQLSWTHFKSLIPLKDPLKRQLNAMLIRR